MKTGIHPTYYTNATVKCACGNEFTVGSTREHIEVEICSACHPFYTGQDKVMDTAGRVERFRARERAAKEKKEVLATKKSPRRRPAVEAGKAPATKKKPAAKTKVKK